ncbi:hypothetical protein DFA_05147 [Cavenderia fasciculata]|uniref:Uncharacterized protein n=1 Tax=Cavenderia fasciculata TaxID=261658 RepID=F4PNG4_CACFS|nr:uncharacterized protein DFA_05147 [Cavenderia fasciculata]EGG23017.1 hypothetical protein DFA_05147 [Cavenderia fasciculata]|eukprot:XP_004360868.1 hypothetical protein DFA_05147 [Cavenderia fasciculata]
MNLTKSLRALTFLNCSTQTTTAASTYTPIFVRYDRDRYLFFYKCRSYARVVESVEVPEELLKKYPKPHRDQPTHARKLRVRREVQVRRNLKLKEHQKPIQDWRLAPVHHLPRFDASIVKPKVDYKNRVDQFEDKPFGYLRRKEEKQRQLKAEEEEIINQLRIKREQKKEEEQRLKEAKTEALKARQQEIVQ